MNDNASSSDMMHLKESGHAKSSMAQGKRAIQGSCCSSPDYLGAIPLFKEAADIFAKYNDPANAVECYKNLAVCNERIDDLFGAAEAHKDAGLIYIEKICDPDKAKEEFEACMHLLNVGGKCVLCCSRLILGAFRGDRAGGACRAFFFRFVFVLKNITEKGVNATGFISYVRVIEPNASFVLSLGRSSQRSRLRAPHDVT